MSTTLRNGKTVDDRRLDWLASVRTDHLEKYPLTTATMPSSAQPIVIGVPWYSAFDRPERAFRRGSATYWMIGHQADLGHVRGGHATCLRPYRTADVPGWWAYYDQGVEGRCVEFAMLRALSLMNRKRYDLTTRWHYWRAQQTDEWQGGSYPGASPQYAGTSVRAGLEVLRQHGAIPIARRGRPLPALSSTQDALDRGLVKPEEGIAAYRWALTWGDVRTVLGVPEWMPGVPMLNSWGKGYPRVTLLADAAGERLLREDGEFGVVTDR